MPLITSTVLAYAAGLLSGFGGAFVFTAAAAGLVVWLGARGRRERLSLAAVAVAGFAIASVSSAIATNCLEAGARARSWELTLEGDASPGEFVAARDACGVQFRLSVEKGRAANGARVGVRGEPMPAHGALVVQRASVREIDAAGTLARWRGAIGMGIDEHFGADAPLVRALLIADMHDVSATVRNRFAAAGLSSTLR